ncbi:metal-sensing transcriptional repressor [bacterium]|nr:metal-sensing transcriptional repressor [bacterium]
MKPELSDRIARVKGLMGGIQTMIQEDRPIEQIAQQIRAAYGALRRAELQIIEHKIRTAKPDELSEVMKWVFKVIK